MARKHGSLAIAASLSLAFSACCTSSPDVGRGVEIRSPNAWAEQTISLDLELEDRDRDREVPIRIYLPTEPGGPLPLVFVSHGIGESRASYEWLGRAIASNGYTVIHPTHRGTDRSVLEEGWLAMYRATQERENWRNRVLDISFILDELPEIEAAESRLEGAFDPDRVGVVGHSAGAWTAAAIAGLELASGESLSDPRIDAIAPLSMPRTGSIEGPEAWASLRGPVLHMTGTCDTQLIWRTFPRHRRIPWEYGEEEDQYLLTLEGGRHTTFSEPWDRSDTVQSILQLLVAESVSAFLDAYVAGDAERRTELRNGAFREIGNGSMKVEQRPDGN
ncbi:MAG: alpha/beta fold hydrolase [Thermoanaerobaculia bacterium]|nr:alpha/beta fold hydrolase [Thermoanaerobaculia bacterium]